MTRKNESLDDAKRLREQGKTYEQIAEALDVGERTIRRWLAPDKVVSKRGEPAWPKDRCWPPDWTVESLADLPDFERSAWEGNLELIATASARGAVFVPWFYKRLVELARENLIPDGAVDWAVAIAALQPLGDWLGCTPACEELEAAIREHRPWESPRAKAGLHRRETARGRYLRASRGSAEALRSVLFNAQAQQTLRDMADRTSTPVPTPVLLGALYARTPQFDKPSGSLLYRRLKLGSIILGLLATAKKGE